MFSSWIEMARLALHLGGLLRIRRAHEVRQMLKRIVEADNNETKVIQSHSLERQPGLD
jgi:hypothetical protein